MPSQRWLVVLSPERSTRYPLPAKGMVHVGRGAQAEVRLDDSSASRLHLRLEVDETIHVTDLDSRNGSRLTGRPLNPNTRTKLGLNEFIQIGSTTLVVEEPGLEQEWDVETKQAPDSDMRQPKSANRMDSVRDLARRVASGDLNVLLTGEPGAGKEDLARFIHAQSLRAGPFIAVSCRQARPGTLESELFGHQRGAFPGADEDASGVVEQAEGGTIFLDHIAGLPIEGQAKLLRLLERRTYSRVGEMKPRSADVRFIAANRDDPESVVADGTFRRDLYFRIAAITLDVPPLRERADEIESLALQFLFEAADRLGRAKPVLDTSTLRALQAHPWPGNVRELRAACERAVVSSRTANPTVRDFGLGPALGGPPQPPPRPTPSKRAASERDRIAQVLAECGGNQTKAAKQLGISRGTLIARIEKYGLPRPRG